MFEGRLTSLFGESLNPGAAGHPALFSPGEDPITYGELLAQIEHVSVDLTRLGYGRGDRVALVVPNGSFAATAFLGIANAAVAAPLNPGYRKEEFDFYLSDLKASALVVASELDSVSREVARRRDIAVIELVPARRGAGLFTLQGDESARRARSENLPDDNTCLVLHTSGTTARPKIVPLTRSNICANALNIARVLRLSKDDRCLNVMPLFHIHGLVGATLATFASGGSLVCAAGPKFPDFFEWMRQFEPTWYTAVPAIHQAVLSNARLFPGKIPPPGRLRLIRSSSAALAPSVMEELGRVFRVPVIESYGMTEASHQIASNPLPPSRQKPGSVGVATGPEVAILGPDGERLEPGKSGDVAIRGLTVMAGYENNPDANRASYVDGWLRTGDLGYFDTDGYLFLVGRVKEIINRGGEKISPREIDEVLLEHPGVMQAVAFSIPHPTLGEDIGAAVVPKGGKVIDEPALRDFARSRLADFKVPRRILVVEDIPKGPSGKLQRIGLYEKLKERLSQEHAEARTPLQEQIAEIWKGILKIDKIGIHDNFFSLGGDSIQALTVIVKAKEAGLVIDPVLSLMSPTIAGLAAIAEPVTTESADARGPDTTQAATSAEPWWRQLRRHL